MTAQLPAPEWEQARGAEEAEWIQTEAARLMREAAGVRPELALDLEDLAASLEAGTKTRAGAKGGEAAARINGIPF